MREYRFTRTTALTVPAPHFGRFGCDHSKSAITHQQRQIGVGVDEPSSYVQDMCLDATISTDLAPTDSSTGRRGSRSDDLRCSISWTAGVEIEVELIVREHRTSSAPVDQLWPVRGDVVTSAREEAPNPVSERPYLLWFARYSIEMNTDRTRRSGGSIFRTHTHLDWVA